MTIITADIRDDRAFTLQVQRIREQLAIPNTRSACLEPKNPGGYTFTKPKPQTLLTESDKTWIKARGYSHLTVMQMARELNVHHSTICGVLRNPRLR